MTKLSRAVVAVLPLAALLAGCAGGAPLDGSSGSTVPTPGPTPTLTPTGTGTDAGELPTGRDLSDWAARALPENRAGGAAPAMRETLMLDAGGAASLDLTQPEGLWEVSFTCQSTDGSPLSYALVAPAADGAVHDIACSAPGDPQPETSVIRYDGDAPVTLEIRSGIDAVLAYEVRQHLEPGS